MALQERLRQTQRAFLSRMSEDRAAIFDVAAARLAASRIQFGARKAGDGAPLFTLPDSTGRAIDLAEVLAAGPLVLTFVQGGWSPLCKVELEAWQRLMPYVRALGTTLLAICPQRVAENARTRDEMGLEFEILSDTAARVATDWGIAHTLPPTVRAVFRQMGLDLGRINGTGGRDSGWCLPLPATYVLAPDGRIAASALDLDMTCRMEPLDALMTVAELMVEAGWDSGANGSLARGTG